MLTKPKQILVMRSKATTGPVVNPGDLFQIFKKTLNEKRRKWSSTRPLQYVDQSAGTRTVPGIVGHGIVSAVEDTRSEIVDED